MTDTSTIDTSTAAVERLISKIETRYRYPGATVCEDGPEGIKDTLRALAAERDQMATDLNNALETFNSAVKLLRTNHLA